MKITALTDYKDYFGSKYKEKPYRGGFDKSLLKDEFAKLGLSLYFLKVSEVDFSKDYDGEVFIYTSSEDNNLEYKNYLSDVLYGLELKGAVLIPSFRFMMAHDNKSFMEILRKTYSDRPNGDLIANIDSRSYGCIEELRNHLSYPVVIKPSKGSLSRGVSLASSRKELFKKVKSISGTKKLFLDSKDYLRSLKHEGYIRESRYRKKFVLQSFISGLEFDWKILVFGDKYYVLRRKNRQNDFRASGSGLLEFTDVLPEGILEYAKRVFQLFDVPMISLDVAYDGKKFYLLEFQAIYFGTYTLEYSKYYFTNKDNKWIKVVAASALETEYALSVRNYLLKLNHPDI